jgi:hypothetical protein
MAIKKKLLLDIASLVLFQLLTACTTTVPLCDNNNVTQFALQSSLAGKITDKQSLVIVRQFFEDIYSNQKFSDIKIEVNGEGFSVAYAQQSLDSGKQYVLLQSTWSDLSSIKAENYNVNFFRRGTFEEFRVKFKGTKSIQTDPTNNQFAVIQKHTDILFEKGITSKYSRRDIALALLILNGRLSVIDANKSAQQPRRNDANAIDQKNYKLILIFILVACLFIIFKFKNMAETRCGRFCSTCQKKFDKDLNNCPTCGERATEIITAAGWTYHIRNDTLPGSLYAYILALICIFSLIWVIATY